MTTEDFCKITGELPDIVDGVRNGNIEPTAKILDAVGWCKFKDSYYKWALVSETRYMQKKDALKYEEN